MPCQLRWTRISCENPEANQRRRTGKPQVFNRRHLRPCTSSPAEGVDVPTVEPSLEVLATSYKGERLCAIGQRTLSSPIFGPTSESSGLCDFLLKRFAGL
jgi:hypothetical protein